MPDREFEYHTAAIDEAWEAYHWYERRSEAVAERFWNELRRARQLVTERPETWSPYLYGTRYFRLWRFPYVLVYTERADRILGIAVAQLNRRPGYWRKRLAD